MKKTLLAALAIAGFAVTAGAQAQTDIGSGSALLYFNWIVDKPLAGESAKPLSNSLVVNLGGLSSSSFARFNLDLNSALVAAYGADWSTSDNIRWAVFGGFSGQEVNARLQYGAIYSRPEGLGGNLDMMTVFNLSAKSDELYSEANMPIYQTGSVISTTGITHKTVLIENGTLDEDNVASNGYGPYNMDIDGLSYWQPTLATYQWQTNTQQIYFNGLQDQNANYGDQPSIKTATITLGTNGVLSVTPVPEPSTYALFGFATLILIVAYRRANA